MATNEHGSARICEDASSVTEFGQPAAEAKGVKFLRMENARAVFEVASGNYAFRSRL